MSKKQGEKELLRRAFYYTQPLDSGRSHTLHYIAKHGQPIQECLDGLLNTHTILGDSDAVQYLLQKGADVHVNDDLSLVWAAMNGYFEVVQILVEKGADVHAREGEALCMAACNGHLDIVKFLVGKGANNVTDALSWAQRRNHYEVAEYLMGIETANLG